MSPQIKISATLINELAQRRRQGRLGTLLTQRPLNLADAFATQQAVISLLGDTIVGWKCGMPSPERWVIAPLLASETTTVTSAAVTQCPIWPSAQGLARVEPELCYVLQHPLPARVRPYSIEDIHLAIGSTHLALELIQTRYLPEAGAGFLDQLADGLFNQGLCLGPAIQGMELAQFPIACSIEHPTEASPLVQHYEGKHPNTDPRLPLHWLVNFLSSHQIDLSAGQKLITGSYAGVLEFPLRQHITLQFGNLGQFSVEFIERNTD